MIIDHSRICKGKSTRSILKSLGNALLETPQLLDDTVEVKRDSGKQQQEKW